MKGFIYKLSAIDNNGLERIYIGSSDRTPKLRFDWHRYECSTCSCYKIFCDIGWDNVAKSFIDNLILSIISLAIIFVPQCKSVID